MLNKDVNSQAIDGNNNVLSGRDIIINQYAFNSRFIVEGISQRTKTIDVELKKTFPEGIYSKRENKYSDFSAEKLLTSLLEIAIPIPIAFHLLEQIPEKLILKKGKGISTTDIRKIIYQGICSLDYIEYGDVVNKWGTSYSRRYGNPDAQIMVIKDNFEEVPLDYNLVTKELIPELLMKCYDDDCSLFLENTNNNRVITTCASEIIEKIKGLNIYKIRYGTIHKIAYDLATHPPHPWFTNEELKKSHKEYHYKKVLKHYENLFKKEEFNYSLIEFIEHGCAYILTEYSLIVGNDRLRPLYLLISYLKLDSKENGNSLIWEGSEISKLEGDLKSINYTVNKFELILSKIRHLVLNSKKLEENSELKTLCKTLFSVIENHKTNICKLESINIHAESFNTFSQSVDFILSFVEKIKFHSSHFYYPTDEYEDMKVGRHFHLLKVYVSDSNEIQKSKLAESKYSNSILVITSQKISKEYYHQIEEEFPDNYNVVYIRIDDLYGIINNSNRKTTFIDYINNSILEKALLDS